jgi:hypothetical protein
MNPPATTVSNVHHSSILIACCNGYHMFAFTLTFMSALTQYYSNTVELYFLTRISPCVRSLLFPLLFFRDQHISDSSALSTSDRLYSTSVRLVHRFRYSLMKLGDIATVLESFRLFSLYNRSTCALITQRL